MKCNKGCVKLWFPLSPGKNIVAARVSREMTALARSLIGPASYREMTNRSGSATTGRSEEGEIQSNDKCKHMSCFSQDVIIMCWWADLCGLPEIISRLANSRWLNKHGSSSGLQFQSCEADRRTITSPFSWLGESYHRIKKKKWWF